MKFTEQRIRELEREIAVTDACICEVRAKVFSLPASDPARIDAGAVIERLLEARATADRSLSTLVAGVEHRPARH